MVQARVPVTGKVTDVCMITSEKSCRKVYHQLRRGSSQLPSQFFGSVRGRPQFNGFAVGGVAVGVGPGFFAGEKGCGIC